MSAIFHTIISNPFYNGFIGLMNLLPFLDAGVIIIIFTVIVKLLMLPLSIKASKTQLQMKSTEKDLNLIKEQYKDNKDEQTRKTMEYYKEKGINPFASFFILLIQLPILIGLYRVFIKSGLPEINTSILYSFIHAPAHVNMVFLGLINVAEKSLLLAVIAGLTTYFQISLSAPKPTGTDASGDLAKAMSMQMKYFFPVLMGFISYSISSAVALYFITSNLFAIAQEYYIKKKYHHEALVV